jgi:hypothetical protein
LSHNENEGLNEVESKFSDFSGICLFVE